MSEITQILLVGFGAAIVGVTLFYLFILYDAEPNVALEAERIYANTIQATYHKTKQHQDFVKISDMPPASGLHFYYPDSTRTENRDAFQVFTLIRLPEYLGGTVNDTSAFRAFSALDVTSHCLIKYWPDDRRDNRIEDPCQSAGYRVQDGVGIFPNAKTLRGPSTGVLPYLDLEIDDQGYLIILPPILDEENNGAIGVGRKMSQDEMEKTSQEILQYYSKQFPENVILPLRMDGEYFFHYATADRIPEFMYFHETSPKDMLRLTIYLQNTCERENWKPQGHGLGQKSFGIDNKTIYYEIPSKDDFQRVYFDFCIDDIEYSIETVSVPFEKMSRIVIDTFIYADDSYELDEALCLGHPSVEFDENCIRIQDEGK